MKYIDVIVNELPNLEGTKGEINSNDDLLFRIDFADKYIIVYKSILVVYNGNKWILKSNDCIIEANQSILELKYAFEDDFLIFENEN